jgi:hypothetical protein
MRIDEFLDQIKYVCKSYLATYFKKYISTFAFGDVAVLALLGKMTLLHLYQKFCPNYLRQSIFFYTKEIFFFKLKI